MIRHLRENEEVILYDNVLNITDQHAKEVEEFLKNEFEKEVLTYPFVSPPFKKEAGLWAAKTVYIAAQLMLYRENRSVELETLLPDLTEKPAADEMISADLCLRFLPLMLKQLKLIDVEDPLNGILEKKLQLWHYSGLNNSMLPGHLDFEVIMSDATLKQLYCNRIIEYRNLKLAEHPVMKPLVKASVGLHLKEFWKELEPLVNSNE